MCVLVVVHIMRYVVHVPRVHLYKLNYLNLFFVMYPSCTCINIFQVLNFYSGVQYTEYTCNVCVHTCMYVYTCMYVCIYMYLVLMPPANPGAALRMDDFIDLFPDFIF